MLMGIVWFAAFAVGGLVLFGGGSLVWGAFVGGVPWVVYLTTGIAVACLCICYWFLDGAIIVWVRSLPLFASVLTGAVVLALARTPFAFEHRSWIVWLASMAVGFLLAGAGAFALRLALEREGAPMVLVVCLLHVLSLVGMVKCWSLQVTPTLGATESSVMVVSPPQTASRNKKLAVFIHGFAGPNASSRVLEALRSHGAASDDRFDVMSFRYLGDSFACNLLVDRDAARIAKDITTSITKCSGRYEEIYLVGHSLGALLARKVLISAHGAASDIRLEPQPWAGKVKRVVMLAGINRGVNIEGNRPSDMSTLLHVGFWLGAYLGDLIDVGRLSAATRSGSPFVANLRLDWVRLLQATKLDVALVQLLGDIDDFVSTDDASDFAVSGSTTRYYPLPVRGTGHGEVQQLATNEEMERIKKLRDANEPIPSELELRAHRRDRFDAALGDLGRLPILTPEAPPGEESDGQYDAAVENVLIVLHGIRDLGRWAGTFENRMLATGKGAKKRIVSPRYGFFGMGPFLLRAQRGKYVRWLMDEITAIMARHPRAKIDFFGHSNGTYLLAKALEDYSSLRLRRVVFAGSVVGTGFPFTFAQPEAKRVGPDAPMRSEGGALGTIEELVNLQGASDWVVACFPSVFEFRWCRWMNRHVGGAGFAGFSDGENLRNVKIAGGHGAFDAKVDDVVAYFMSHAPDFSERAACVRADDVEPSRLLCGAAAGGQVAIYLFVALVLFAVGTLLVGSAGPYSTQIAILYVLAIGWVLSRL